MLAEIVAMDSSMYNVASIEKDCNALGGLFQQIINDMKVGTEIRHPSIYGDLLSLYLAPLRHD